MAQAVAQHCIDFPSVNHFEHHYMLHHFHINHLHYAFSVALILAIPHCVKQALQLMKNLGILPNVFT
jgi:predicted transcriptional regulator